MFKFLKYSLFILLLILEVSLYSQSVVLGAKAGPNFTNISGYYPFISSHRESISAGVFVLKPMSKRIDGIFEINYEQKGFKYSSQDFSNNTKTEGERIYDYLTMPAGFKYNFGKNVKPYFKTGIFLAILMNAQDNGTETNYAVAPPEDRSWENSIMYKTESVDWGIFFSLGVQYKISSKILFLVEGSLNSGLLMLEPDKILVEEMRNKSFLVSFGFGYSL